MALQVITDAELLKRLSLHKAWLSTFKQQANSQEGEQLCLFDVSIPNIEFSDTDLSSAKIVRCDLTGSVFRNCNFSDTILIDSSLKSCRFLDSSLIDTDFASADCSSSFFSHCDLTRADFTETNARHSHFENCILSWAWFIGTDLSFAFVKDIELQGARFSNTKLFGFTGIQLHHLEQATIESIDIGREGENEILSKTEALQWLLHKSLQVNGQ